MDTSIAIVFKEYLPQIVQVINIRSTCTLICLLF